MKPELLLPVGNTESFYAAVEGGADSVYLGLRSFNARGRAPNFTPNQLQSLLKEANQLNIKVYLTLNTLIKNNELSQLLDILYLLSQTKISSIHFRIYPKNTEGILYVIRFLNECELCQLPNSS